MAFAIAQGHHVCYNVNVIVTIISVFWVAASVSVAARCGVAMYKFEDVFLTHGHYAVGELSVVHPCDRGYTLQHVVFLQSEVGCSCVSRVASVVWIACLLKRYSVSFVVGNVVSVCVAP